MPNKIRDEVYKRIVLAKSLHKAGESACSNLNDQMVFTKGILLLHDAAEAALGAVADHLQAQLKDKNYLLDYYSLIENADPQKKPVLYRKQMNNLNILRVNAKHHGILPDMKSNAHFITTVFALIDDLCQKYLSLDFASVSLKNLIKNTNVLGYINDAENEIKKGNIESSLILLAYSMYHICEFLAMSSLFHSSLRTKEDIPFQFTDPYRIEFTVNLIEHGVDPYLYSSLK